jgi:hypothetical protein
MLFSSCFVFIPVSVLKYANFLSPKLFIIALNFSSGQIKIRFNSECIVTCWLVHVTKTGSSLDDWIY